MGRRVEIVCDKCGATAPGTSDPNFLPIGWGSVELGRSEEVKVGKTREVVTYAQVCGPCAELIRLAIVTKVSPIGGES